jgi:hypothetical protein
VFTCVLACVLARACVVYSSGKCAHLTPLRLHTDARVASRWAQVGTPACSPLPTRPPPLGTAVGEYDCVLFPRGSVLPQ